MSHYAFATVKLETPNNTTSNINYKKQIQKQLNQQQQIKLNIKSSKAESLNLQPIFNHYHHLLESQKINSMPLQFEYVPVQILSKQFTKLNSQHSFRIHYLGPRFINTSQMHKKFSFSEKYPWVFQKKNNIFNESFLEENNKNKKEQPSSSDTNVDQQSSLNKKDNRNEINKISQQQQNQNFSMKKSLVNIPIVQRTPLYQNLQRYRIDHRKIVQSYFMSERLKTNHFYKSSIFYRAFQGMNPSLNLKEQFIFDSGFQSGNLDCVIKIKSENYVSTEFDLFLKIDSNTRGHTQWFFFSVKNVNKKQKIIMNICNLTKAKTLYECGMKPYVYSQKKYKKKGVQWIQDGVNISLQQKELRYQFLYDRMNVPNMYCLTLEYQFTEINDQVFFAYCIPFTYSQMIQKIEELPKDLVKTYNLGRSLAGVNIPVLHITQHQKESKKNQNEELQIQNQRQKKNIFITGRIHPAQSNSSHMLFGFIKFLCSNKKQAVQLRKRTNFIIVPMVNPDGVILGNSRSSAAGRDLNRQYIEPNRDLYPQVFLIKDLAYKLQSKYGLIMYFDFHGHSRKKNTFFYGPIYGINQPDYYKCRILPKLIQKQNCAFRYHSCAFNITDQKKKTARAAMFTELKIPYTYTIQTSIGSYYDSQKMSIFQFTKDSWMQIGHAIGMGTSLFFISFQEYQQFLKERRIQRFRKMKKDKNSIVRNLKINFLDQEGDQQTAPEKQQLKIFYNKTSLFAQAMSQIKNLMKIQKQTKNIDDQLSSDDHDQAQDLDVSKLKQFNNLVIQNAKKDYGLNTRMNIKEQNRIKDELKRKINKVKSFISPRDQQQLNLLDEISNNKKMFQTAEKPKTSGSNRIKRNLNVESKLKNMPVEIDRQQKQRQRQKLRQQNKSFNISFSGTQKDLFSQIKQEEAKANNNPKYFSIKNKRVSTSYGRIQEKQLAISKTNIMSEYPFALQLNTSLANGNSLNNPNRKFQRNSIFKKNESQKNKKKIIPNEIQMISHSQNLIYPQKQIQIRPQSHRTKNYDIKLDQFNKNYINFASQQKQPIQFKFDEIVGHFNNRSRMFGQPPMSLKSKKGKNRSSSVYPSSFYGVKQQYTSKKKNLESVIAVQNFECFEMDPKSFTVKTIKK